MHNKQWTIAMIAMCLLTLGGFAAIRNTILEAAVANEKNRSVNVSAIVARQHRIERKLNFLLKVAGIDPSLLDDSTSAKGLFEK